jgi:hypothetical protein
MSATTQVFTASEPGRVRATTVAWVPYTQLTVERLSVRRLHTALRQTQTAAVSQLAVAEQSESVEVTDSEEAGAPRLRCPHCGEWITLPV